MKKTKDIFSLVPLKELGELGRGKSRHRPRHDPILYDGNYPFIQTGDVKAANKHITHYEKTYNEHGLKQSKLWPKGTLCITIAANIAETGILGIDACFPDSIVGFIPNEEKCHLDYVYYFLKFHKQEIQKYAYGTVQDNINLSTFDNILIPLPSLAIQRQIASILSSLDDKIRVNHKINSTLKEMAQKLYKHWFVDFGPFQDGEFEKNNSRIIPKGWEIKELGSLYKTSSGGTPSRKKKDYYENGNINWLKTKELNDDFIFETEEKITELAIQKSSAKIFPVNTVIIAMYGATVGRLGILSNDSSTNQACCAIISQNNTFTPQYIYEYLSYNREKIIDLANGGAQQNINQQIIKSLPVLVPKEDVLSRFNHKLTPLFNLRKSLHLENKALIQTRDYLLPLLISGEVTLKEAAKITKEVLTNG
ncbi:restriction endonuclease subunit S [Bacillus cereus group sp. BfR-BA-01523]|uniref:restriction endonuclease subunit S n=1 Tax=Bacillus cereus group sp. BfR-BA-01523 TaxID=2920371 RepID=UPI001F5757DB|nr:restriction endonuclease subunit S [Bacillus cereus group sp. BfR-BA-01523]